MRGHSGGHAADLLVAKLQARTGLTGVSVRREPPRNQQDLVSSDGTPEVIFVGRVDPSGRVSQDVTDISADFPFAKAPPAIFDETYTLWVTVSVLKANSAGTQKAATDRAVVLLGEVLGTVAADPTLGFADSSDLSTFWCRGVTAIHNTGSLEQGNGAGFAVGLRFQCRLHLS